MTTEKLYLEKFMEPKQSKRFPELMIYPDGRAYDTIRDNWLPLQFEHNCQYKGPVLYWKTKSRVTYLQVSRLVYETFIEDTVLNPKWSVVSINGDENDVRPENFKKIIKNKPAQEKRIIEDFSDWMGPDSVFM